jgi:hypothetical protein
VQVKAIYKPACIIVRALNKKDYEKGVWAHSNCLSQTVAALEGMSKKHKVTDRILAQLLEGQIRLLEKEGRRSYGHGRLSKKQRVVTEFLLNFLRGK